MNYDDEQAVITSYGFNWGWHAKSGKRVWVHVARMMSLKGRGAALRVYAGDIDKGPRLDIYVSDGGRVIRCWLNDKEMKT